MVASKVLSSFCLQARFIAPYSLYSDCEYSLIIKRLENGKLQAQKREERREKRQMEFLMIISKGVAMFGHDLPDLARNDSLMLP